MKWLILLSVVAFAKAQDQAACIAKCTGPFYEPGTDDLPFSCKICTDPLVRTFDMAYLEILDEQKTLLSVWDTDVADSCKYNIRVVTTDDCSFPNFPVDAPIFMDWIGIGMHVAKNTAKTKRNWMFGQTLTHIGERGPGFITPTLRDLPWCFPYEDDSAGWFRPPLCDPLYCAFVENDMVKMRSPVGCCELAIDWFPHDTGTCLTISIGNHFAGETRGLCGNSNGDEVDDWESCGATCTAYTADCLQDISDACDDGSHDGQGYVGCSRLDEPSPPSWA